MRWAALSDIGKVREINEDSFLARPDSSLFAVADGMGGHKAGEVASAMALDVFARSFDHVLIDERPADVHSRLVQSVLDANQAVFDESHKHQDYSGMGTTLTAVAFGVSDMFLVHVGDSRAYLFRDGSLARLTVDHTLLQEMLDRGDVTPDAAKVHPLRNVITRALGTYSQVEVDFKVHDTKPGDRVLLTSDGLTSKLEEPWIEQLLKEQQDLNAACRALVELAIKQGGEDNITTVLIET